MAESATSYTTNGSRRMANPPRNSEDLSIEEYEAMFESMTISASSKPSTPTRSVWHVSPTYRDARDDNHDDDGDYDDKPAGGHPELRQNYYDPTEDVRVRRGIPASNANAMEILRGLDAAFNSVDETTSEIRDKLGALSDEIVILQNQSTELEESSAALRAQSLATVEEIREMKEQIVRMSDGMQTLIQLLVRILPPKSATPPDSGVA